MLQSPPSPVASICTDLVSLGKARTITIKRQFMIERPLEQSVRFWMINTGAIDREASLKAQYGHAQKLCKTIMDHVSLDWPEISALCFSSDFRQASEAFKARLTSECGATLTEAEMMAAMYSAQQVASSKVALQMVLNERKTIEAAMTDSAKQLPVFEWWKDIRGCGALGLAKIIGETGDLSNYDNPGKVWKRLGLHVYQGKAPSSWKMSKPGLSADEWTEAGYCPRRRSAMYTIGDALIKTDGEYRDLFLERKRIEFDKAETEGLVVVTTTKATAENWRKLGLPVPEVVKKFDPKIHRGVAHINARAQRYMEKRLIRELWKAWREY